MLGCKCKRINISQHRPGRINRYMLGCKYEYSMADEKTGEGINRYMLGCKSVHSALLCDILRELIDTCWDVNLCIERLNRFREHELIDTCWDVNKKFRKALL